jgi:competence protein ComEC
MDLDMYLSVSENAARVVQPNAGRRATFQNSHLEVRMFYVGHGEAILIRFPDGRSWFVEAASGGGTGWTTNNALGAGLSQYLQAQQLTLDALVMCHAHKDHAAAVPALLQTPGYLFTAPLPLYRPLSSSWQSATGWRAVFWDAIQQDGDVVDEPITQELRVVPVANNVDAFFFADPGADVYKSLFLQLRFHGARLLFTGDAKCRYENNLLTRFGPAVFRSDVLKITHHGSSSGTSANMVAVVRHGIAIASTGDEGGIDSNEIRSTVWRFIQVEVAYSRRL